MMRATTLICLLVAVTSQEQSDGSNDLPWKWNTVYKYRLRSRTLTGLHQVSSEYTGVLIRADAVVQRQTDDIVSVQVQSAEYGEVQATLPAGWASAIPDSQVNFHLIQLHNNVFKLQYKNGVIRRMVTSRNATVWELNWFRSIASQLQLDTRAENLIDSDTNIIPEHGSSSGTFNTVEVTVSGECETSYNISPLPESASSQMPQFSAFTRTNTDNLISVLKTINFDKCNNLPTYHFGFSGLTDLKPAGNRMGSFLERSSASRVFISGDLQSYTIQSSVTTDKLVIRPLLYNEQNGMVVSRVNLTLVERKSVSTTPLPLDSPWAITDLVYDRELSPLNDNTAENNKDSDSSEAFDTNQDKLLKTVLLGKNHRQNKNLLNKWSKQRNKNSENFEAYKNANFSSSVSPDSLLDADKNEILSNSIGDNDVRTLYGEGKNNWLFNLRRAQNIPFLPFTKSKGEPFKSAEEVDIVWKMSLQIGHDLENPSSIPRMKTLRVFTLLTQILRRMDFIEMKAASQKIYFQLLKDASLNSTSTLKYRAWVAFRDAVAQAGSGPALLTIKGWIDSRQVQGEEAAQLLSTLPKSALFPNEEYLDVFFNLVKSPVVTEESFLNTSALLSFTELTRKALVQTSTVRRRYPIHLFGPLSNDGEKLLVQKYIPYFTQRLEQAVARGNSVEIRTVIVALGNLAHPRVLEVFVPYLEGRKPLKQFQRLTIITSLKMMAKLYPETTQPLLYSIYRNVGEGSELRVAAVFQLIKTKPSAHMLQQVARLTNEDQDTQVISAVQSAVRSAADGPDRTMRINAQAAVKLLSPKQYSAHLSKTNVQFAQIQNMVVRQSLSYIGSDDSLTPSNIFYSLHQNFAGVKRQTFGFSAISSSLSALQDLVKNKIMNENFNQPPLFKMKRSTALSENEQDQPHNQENSTYPSWSPSAVADILGMTPGPQKQVEASLFVTTPVGKRFFAVDNGTFKNLPDYMWSAFCALRDGHQFNYTKMADQLSVTIALPMASGLPFTFNTQAPTLVQVGGSLRALNRGAVPSGVSADVHFVYSTVYQSEMGFIAPFSENQYVAGTRKTLQVNIPVKAEVEYDSVRQRVASRVQPLPHCDHSLLQYSTEPYTATRNIVNMVTNPWAEMERQQIVHVRRANQIHKTFGMESSGFAFDVDYTDEQSFIDFGTIYTEAFNKNLWTAAVSASIEKSIDFKNITLTFNPNRSLAQYAKLTAVYSDHSDELKVDKYGEESDFMSQRVTSHHISASIANATSLEPDSLSRRHQFLSRVGAGIRDSLATVVDLSAEFVGERNTSYVATFAAATSFTSPRARYLFFGNSHVTDASPTQSQVLVAMETNMPIMPLMNFTDALAADPTSSMSAELVLGDTLNPSSSRVTIQGKMERSSGRTQYLAESPLGQLCEQQMAGGNVVQSACRDVTAHTLCLDKYNIQARFEQLSDYWKSTLYKSYSALRHHVYLYASENLFNPNFLSNKVDIEVNFAYDLDSVNVSVQAPLFSAELSDLRVDRHLQPVVVVSTEYSAAQRTASYLLQEQYNSVCVVDGNRVETFDNRSYPVSLGPCWHSVFHYSHPHRDNVSVLVRDRSEHTDSSPPHRRVMLTVGVYRIYLDSDEGRILVQNPQGDQSTASQEHMSELLDWDGKTVAQFYALPSGAVRLFANWHGVQIQYDGKAVKLLVENSYRSKVRGLCGTFNSQPADDFTTPLGRVVQDPLEFTSSYIVDGDCQALGSPTVTKSTDVLASNHELLP